MNNWNAVSRQVKENIVDYMNGIVLDMKNAEKDSESLRELLREEQAIIYFLDTIGLPVGYGLPTHWSEYIALDDEETGYLDEWIAEKGDYDYDEIYE